MKIHFLSSEIIFLAYVPLLTFGMSNNIGHNHAEKFQVRREYAKTLLRASNLWPYI